MVTPIVHRGTEPEGRAIADELGIAYDGIQIEVGFQFTDVRQTGTTFYARTLAGARAGLAKKRRLFARGQMKVIVLPKGER